MKGIILAGGSDIGDNIFYGHGLTELISNFEWI